MQSELRNDRSYAVVLARRYFYEQTVTVDAIVDTFAETEDPLIARLVDLIIHEPARSGKFLTVSQRDYERNYWPAVADVLEQLERGEAGVLPSIRPWSKTRIFWVSVLALFVGASAAEHMLRFIRHVTGESSLSALRASWELAVGVFLSVLCVAVCLNVISAIGHWLKPDA